MPARATARPGRPRARLARTARVLVALGLALAAVTGCAASPRTPPQAAAGSPLPKYYDAGALLAAVSARERSDGGALMTFTGTLDGPSGRRSVTGEGVVRFAAGAVPVRFDQRVGAPGAVPRTTGLVRTGGRTWVRAPARDRWLELGVDDVPPADRGDATLATNLAGAADPLAGVSRYAEASLVSDAVDEIADGVRTVRYTIVVDLARAAATETDPALRTQLADQVAAGRTRISTVVWVDADQRPVRAGVRQELPGAGALDLLVGYRAWGTPARVDPPAAAG